MYDYHLIQDGVRIPVAKVSTEHIVELIRDPSLIYINNAGNSRDPVGDVLKRLRLELDIRALGLRE